MLQIGRLLFFVIFLREKMVNFIKNPIKDIVCSLLPDSERKNIELKAFIDRLIDTERYRTRSLFFSTQNSIKRCSTQPLN